MCSNNQLIDDLIRNFKAVEAGNDNAISEVEKITTKLLRNKDKTKFTLEDRHNILSYLSSSSKT